jgi:hypothetical protein
MDCVQKQMADDEDDSEYDDPSNPSSEDDDLEDGEDNSVGKALVALRKAGRGINWDENTDIINDRGRGHENLGGASLEADHAHRPETYQLSTTAAVGGQQTRHKFTDKVDRIQQEESVGRATAMTRARQRHPELYTSFQEHTAAQSTPNQAASRAMNRTVDKRAPSCWEEAVSAEMARSGVTAEMAKVRLAQAHGYPMSF